MKYIAQISRETGISESTLKKRIIANEIIGQRIRKCLYLNNDQIALIIGKQQRQYKGLVNSVDDRLIQTFRLLNPTLVAEEVTFALGVNLERVKIAFKSEYLILPSSMNRK